MVLLAISSMLVLRVVYICSQLKGFYIDIHGGEIALLRPDTRTRALFDVRELDGVQVTFGGAYDRKATALSFPTVYGSRGSMNLVFGGDAPAQLLAIS